MTRSVKEFVLLVGSLSVGLTLVLVLWKSLPPTIRPLPAPSVKYVQDPMPDVLLIEVVAPDGDVVGRVPVLKVGDEHVGSGTVQTVPVEFHVKDDLITHEADGLAPGRGGYVVSPTPPWSASSVGYPMQGLPVVGLRLSASRPTGTR